MQKGFKKIAPALIQTNPWLTADEYAKMALDQHLCRSDSKNGPNGQVFSLSTTLRKEVREGRMPGIKSVRMNDGKLHFGPADHTPAMPSRRDTGVTVVLPVEVADITDMLVAIDQFKNRSEALIWLAQEGVKAKQVYLQQCKTLHQQAKQLKGSI